MHLALWCVVLVCHQYDVCENYVGSVYVGGYGGLSESELCVFCKLCPVYGDCDACTVVCVTCVCEGARVTAMLVWGLGEVWLR